MTQVDGEGDFVKVLDFGLVKYTDADASAHLTTGGWALGTPQYVSPEVAEGSAATVRSDVYALGGVLYFALCGAPPFEHVDLRQLLIAHVAEPPVAPSIKLGRPLPAAVEAVVMRCLDKDPARRYASARELAVALEQAVAARGRTRPPAASGSTPELPTLGGLPPF